MQMWSEGMLIWQIVSILVKYGINLVHIDLLKVCIFLSFLALVLLYCLQFSLFFFAFI